MLDLPENTGAGATREEGPELLGDGGCIVSGDAAPTPSHIVRAIGWMPAQDVRDATKSCGWVVPLDRARRMANWPAGLDRQPPGTTMRQERNDE